MMKKISTMLVFAAVSLGAQAATGVADKKNTNTGAKTVEVKQDKDVSATQKKANVDVIKANKAAGSETKREFDICYGSCAG